MTPLAGTPTIVQLGDRRIRLRLVTENAPDEQLTPLAPPPSLLQPLSGDKAVIVPSPPVLPTPAIEQAVFDHKLIGGSFTLFILMYGDYPELHKKCLESVLATTHPGNVEIRIGCNQVCSETRTYLKHKHKEGRVGRIYNWEENLRKYPAMRLMFHDADVPIDTKWVIWMDDDTVCNKRSDWLTLLAKEIISHSESGHHLYGPPYFTHLGPSQITWMREGNWYRGKPWADKKGRSAPNGTCVHFASGSFWCVSTEAIKVCDIPDARLTNNMGDIVNGAALYQNGYKLRAVSHNKSWVTWSGAPRRGVTEKPKGW